MDFYSQKISGRIFDQTSLENPCLSAPQSEVDHLVEDFIHHATDWKLLAALTAGGTAYRLGRSGASAMDVGRLISAGIGLTTEVAAFELTSRGLQWRNPSPWRWEGAGGLKQGLLSSWVSFGILRGLGKLTRGQNLILQHGVQDFGMMLGHQLVFQTLAGPRPEGNLTEQLLRAELMNLQLSAGTALTHLLAPGLALWGNEKPRVEKPPISRTGD